MAHTHGPRRFPATVFSVGEEPDARFTLANERTFLAWIRTALGFLAGGVALELLGLDLQPQLRLAASIVLIVAGMLIPVFGWFGWARAEKAMRLSAALPASPLGLLAGLAVVVASVLVLLAILLR